MELVTKAPRKVSELTERFDISFFTIFKPIRILEQSGFVKRKITGREHQITVQQKSLDKVYE